MSLSAATQNGCRTQDFSLILDPFKLQSKLERDLGSTNIAKIQFDVKDDTGAQATALGPGTTSFGTTTRYFSPWVMIQEAGVTVFLGYLDQNSIEWDEDHRKTQFDAYHAAQMLQDRLASSLGLVRANPGGPTGGAVSFTATTGDDLMNALVASYTPRANKLTIEQQLWSQTEISWAAWISQVSQYDSSGPRPVKITDNFPAPVIPSSRITISGNSYVVSTTVVGFTYQTIISGVTTTYSTLVLVLFPVGVAPTNLNTIGGFGIGSTLNFDMSYADRSNYTLVAPVPGPVSGSDGQRFLLFDTVQGLIPGDKLVIPLVDTNTRKNRRTTVTYTVEDIDGERNMVNTLEPINQALPSGSIATRESNDPIFADAYGLCKALAAPFPVDQTNFGIFATTVPVLTWLAGDKITAGSPQLYGMNNVDVITPQREGTEEIRYTTRGSLALITYFTTLPGSWTGSDSSSFTWQGSYNTISGATDNNIGGEYLCPVTQWPGANVSSFYKPPILFYGMDLTGGANVPPNGWAQGSRSLGRRWNQMQDAYIWWNGTALQWAFIGAPGVFVTNGGSGYTSAPAVAISGGGGAGAAATAVILNNQVVGVVVTAGGSGYTSAPTIAISGGGGTGATATATVVNGQLAGEIPTKFVFYTSQCSQFSGRNTFTGGTTFIVEQHIANNTYFSGATKDITGTLPTGGQWMSFGMWPKPTPTPTITPTFYQDMEHVAAIYTTGAGTANWTISQIVTFTYGPGSMAVIGTTILESGTTAQGVWGMAGGLAVKISEVNINNYFYPYTTLYLVDEQGTVTKQTMYGIEIIKSTICPMALALVPKRPGDPVGYTSSNKINGWIALGIESYIDKNFVMSRRLRMIWFDYQLNIKNGDLIPSVFSSTLLVRIGDVVVDPIPEGAILARMVRANDAVQTNKCYGFVGGRRFLVDFAFSRTIERLNLSGNEDKSCMDVIQEIMKSLMSNAVPQPNGSIALVSRNLGTRRLRTFGSNQGSFQIDEQVKYKLKPSGNNYYNTINVTYNNDITGTSETDEITGYGNGGTTLNINLSMTNAGATQSRAIGVAYGQNFGVIPSTALATIRETSVGAPTSSAAAPYWASWVVGDKVLPVPAAPGSTVNFWKLMGITRNDETRTADIEIEQLSYTETL